MEHKIYMNYIHPSSLLRQLSDLWRAEQLCDAVITVDKIIVAKAHKVVLFAISSKLKSDFYNSSQSPILDVSMPAGVSHIAVHSFLQYLYEGHLILTRKLAKDLLKISTFLKITCLLNCCSDYLDSLDKADDVIMLDDEPENSGSNKSEEFNHIRTSAVDKTLLQINKSENETEPSPSKAKKHKSDRDSPGRAKESPVHTFSQPSPSKRPSSSISDSDSRDNVSSVPDHSVHPQTSFTVQSVPSVKVKTEISDSCALSGSNDWQATQDSANLSNPNTVFPTEFSIANVKEEVEDVSVDPNFLQNMSHDDEGEFEGQTWFSTDSEVPESLNQSAPVMSISSPMIGTSQGNFPQRAMTPFSSLKQMRAQQSIKRSIQSSVSAARRARNIQLAGAASASSSAMDQGDDQSEQGGGGSLEEVYVKTENAAELLPNVAPADPSLVWLNSEISKPSIIRMTHQTGQLRKLCQIVKSFDSIPHNDNDTTVCWTCGNFFKESFEEHRSVCVGVGTEALKDLVCTKCGKKFKTKKNLHEHEKGEHHDRQYSCKNCLRIFKWRSSLKHHMLSCSQENEKMFLS